MPGKNGVGALVIGGHTQGLGIIRMLGEKNVPVCLMDKTGVNVARYSRYCDWFIKAPQAAYETEENFVEFLVSACEEQGLHGMIIYPTDDLVVSYLSRNKKELSRYYTIWTPAWDVIEHCYNKRLTYQLAEKIGIPCPKSYFPANAGDIERISGEVDYPVIIKPAVMHEFYHQTGSKVFLCKDRGELLEGYAKAVKIIDPSEVIVQEIIPGPAANLYSFGSFYKGAGQVAYVIGRRARQIPMDFGKASTYVELFDEPGICEPSLKLLNALRYYGLSEVEFKYDPRDGMHKLLEINPRTWKWHSIAGLVGLDLPYMLYCDLLGINDPDGKIKPGISHGGKWIDLYTDLYVSTAEVVKRNMSIGGYVRSAKGPKVMGDLSLADPMPFIAETIFLPYLMRR